MERKVRRKYKFKTHTVNYGLYEKESQFTTKLQHDRPAIFVAQFQSRTSYKNVITSVCYFFKNCVIWNCVRQGMSLLENMMTFDREHTRTLVKGDAPRLTGSIIQLIWLISGYEPQERFETKTKWPTDHQLRRDLHIILVTKDYNFSIFNQLWRKQLMYLPAHILRIHCIVWYNPSCNLNTTCHFKCT